MEIVKIINNNIVSALDDENKEIVVMGKDLVSIQRQVRRYQKRELRRFFD